MGDTVKINAINTGSQRLKKERNYYFISANMLALHTLQNLILTRTENISY